MELDCIPNPTTNHLEPHDIIDNSLASNLDVRYVKQQTTLVIQMILHDPAILLSKILIILLNQKPNQKRWLMK